ncbi:cyclic nucleotide-binding domain protein (macronuclear) [Tetrahymena thermophila SB210]|uniref:Cyclic nucleotide-binding domain protein n=1 Tax=Tetrahymena thermophila (strain SB210) TaxID=312017 RepID=Q23TB7_TETTS|nr:cyclic nucleotide-binding domain protein [Tetrahymena thermophila SB210]EAR99789.2 cyclic nucleotide-binding domain protein [Tetrahymena thermophila SB210]|eukprot:XP_001020034.2 cyclic nucleotide-binding domain protein [Tetrahymena thermophila SB210]
MDAYVNKINGGRGTVFHQGIKASIRQTMSKDISNLSLEQKKQLTANILQLDLKDRKEDEINVLKQLTEHLDFFIKINSKKINQETKLHEKCCRRLKYESYQKGETVIEYGAKADKFFIILSGQVSIFLIKSQEALDIEEHQLKTGKKLNAWNGGLLNINDEEEQDEINSPSSSVASSNNNNRRESYQMANSPLQRKYSQRLSIVRDSPKMNGQQEDKNLLQINNISQLDNNNNDDSPMQLEKITEKSKFSNYSPPLNRDKIQNASFRIKLNFDDQIQELVHEENTNKLDSKTGEQEEQIQQNNNYQQNSENDQIDNNGEQNIQKINTQLQKRQMNQLFLKVDASNQNKFRSSSEIVANNILNHSNSSPQSLTYSRTISRMTMLQQAIKNNAEVGSIFKKKINSESITEMRQRLNQMSASQDLISPSSSSHTISNLGTPSKLSSSYQKSSQLQNRNDIFTFLEDEKLQQIKSQVNQSGKNITKKTRLGKLIDFYKNYDLFGSLQLSEIQNAEKYFTDSGIFKYEYRDIMKAGNTFGELGILEGKPRSALIICSEDSEFAIMEKEDYSELLAERDRKKLLKKFEFLKQKMFPELTNDGIKKIFYSFQKRIIQKNEVLFQEGDKANGIFIIKHGEVNLSQRQKVEQQIPNQRDILASESCLNTATDSPAPIYQKKKSLLYKPQKFTQKTFAVISSGEYFGEEDLLIKENKQIRTFTATCSSLTGSVYYIEANVFLKFIKQKPTSFLVIQKRLNQKLQWRTEQKEKWNEQKKKFSFIDSFQQIEEAKIKQIIRKNVPKRSSMIELKSQSSSTVFDTPSTTTPSRRTTTISLRQPNSSSFTLSNIEGSLTQIPIVNRDLQTLQTPQAKISTNNAVCSINMDKIWEEKSNDGSPKNSHLNSENLIGDKAKSYIQNYPQNKMVTEESQRIQNSPFYKQQRNSEINLQCIRSKTPKLSAIHSSILENTFSPLNKLSKQTSSEIKSQLQTHVQDIEGLRKSVNLSKNNWQSVKKTRQTYSNYEINNSQDLKIKLNFQRQASIQLKTQYQSSQSSLAQFQSTSNLQTSDQLYSQTFLQRQTTSNSNSESPIKKSISDNQLKLLGFSQVASNSTNNNQLYLYSQGVDINKEQKKLPQISSPQFKTDHQLQMENQEQKKLAIEKKKLDIIKKTQFFEYKQQLQKKEALYDSHNIQDLSDKKGFQNNGLHIEIIQPSSLSIRSNSQTSSPQRKKVISLIRNNGFVKNIIKKVQGKSDQIDSILRIDELQQSSLRDQDQIKTELSNKFQERSLITELDEKKKNLQRYQLISPLSKQDKIIYPTTHLEQFQIKKQFQQENSIENKIQNSNQSVQKSQSLPKSNGQFQKIEFYQKLKQNLLQNQQKTIQIKLQQQQQQQQNNESPNNFIVQNYSKLNQIQHIN